jgi:hypothetical protein
MTLGTAQRMWTLQEYAEKYDALQAENARLKEAQRAPRKCECGEPIFSQAYCERCRKQWES